MDDLRARYRALAVEWDEASNEPKRANQLFDQLRSLYLDLRERLEGREATTGLLDDPVTGVRLASATHSLAWTGARAEQVLHEIEKGPGLHAVTAKWTLRSYRSGTLDLDWLPSDS